jgi:hypothetical protein
LYTSWSASGGVGNTTIRIPAGVAVHLTIDAGGGHVRFPDAYVQQGDVYVSPGFASAANRVDLTVSSRAAVWAATAVVIIIVAGSAQLARSAAVPMERAGEPMAAI